MSEYYIGAICANSNYLEHSRPKGVKNGEGKYFRFGIPTALGRQVYGQNAGYTVVGERGNIKAPAPTLRKDIRINEAATKLVPKTTTNNILRGAKNNVNKQAVSNLKTGLEKAQFNSLTSYQAPTLVITKKDALTGATIPSTKTLRSGAEKIAETVGNWGNQAVGDVKDWLSGAKDTVKTWLSGAGDWIKSSWNTAINWCKNAGKNMFGFAKKVVGKATQWGGVAINAIKSAARFVGGFFRGIMHTPDYRKGDYRQGSGYEAGYHVRTGVQNFARDVGKTVDNVGRTATDFFDTVTGRRKNDEPVKKKKKTQKVTNKYLLTTPSVKSQKR